MLEKYLGHENYIIKDGAIIGLSFLDDPKTISTIRAQLEKEKNKTSIDDLKDLLNQLLETKNAQNSKKGT